MSAPPVLSTPLELPCGARLSNRLAKAAMSEQLATRHNAPSLRLVRLYEQWARSGAGLLISGNVMIDRTARSEPRQVVVDGAHEPPLLRQWAQTGRAGGGHVWLQVNHAGRQTPRLLARHPVAPSAIRMRGAPGMFGTPRALTPREIEALIERFAAVSELAVRAGFTGIQIHAAHGYLISQFLAPRTNRRTDAWGGDPERRRRFLEEVVRAVRQRIGPAVPLSVKLNSADGQPGGVTAEEALETVQWLAANRVDLIEISGGNFESASMMGRPANEADTNTPRREAYFLTFAERARETTHVPLMLTGGFRMRSGMVRAVASGAVDVIGLARPMALDPRVPARVLAGEVADVGGRALTVPTLFRDWPVMAGMTEVAWHTGQLWRLAAGRRPWPTRRATSSLVHYVSTQLLQLSVGAMAQTGRAAVTRGPARSRVDHPCGVRRHSERGGVVGSPEDPGEVGRAVVADPARHLCHRQVGVHEQPARLGEEEHAPSVAVVRPCGPGS